jgi:4-amino-4-deoxy-L-arabinose transferase-like glycosyltransferase
MGLLGGWHVCTDDINMLPQAIWRYRKLLIAALICFGVALRLGQYLANRSLWLDESLLTLNIVHRSFSQLLQPLDYSQGAPILFLMFSKISVTVLGINEYALRLFPLLSGIASIFIFYEISKKFLKIGYIPLALAFFIVSDRLIYYSSEVKQYSSDVLVALLLYLVSGHYLESEELTSVNAVFCGVMSAALIWLSHGAVFVLEG